MKTRALFTTCSVSALALILSTAAGQAQNTTAAPSGSNSIETVTVTGVVAAVSGALNIKQNSGQMVDAIVSEDIGKLPDNNVVQALQHVTGIAIVQNSVEPSTVLIRGLPDVQTLLNGREIFTATGRALSLPDIPAELLARVDVHKTSTAADLEGGIAGLINVRLHRPFDFDGEEVAGTIQGMTESLAQHIDPQASLLVSNRWHTDLGEVGLLMDISYKNTHSRTDQFTHLNPIYSNVVGPVPGAGSGPAPVCTLGAACPVETAGAVSTKTVTAAQGVAPGYAVQTPNLMVFQTLGKIERGSLNLSAQWRPSSNLTVFAEGFDTLMDSYQPVNVVVELKYICPDPAQDTVYPGTNVVSKSVSSCYNLTSMQDRLSHENTLQLASGFDWGATENWEITGEVNETLSSNKTLGYVVDDTYNIPQDGLQIIDNYQGTMGMYINNVANASDGSQQYIDQLFDQRSVGRGAEWDVRLDSTYVLGNDTFLRDVMVGYRLSDRSAHNTGSFGGALNCITNPNPSLEYNNLIIAANASQACTGPSGYVTLGGGGAGGATPQTAAANYTHIGGISLADLAPNNAAIKHTSGLFFGGKFGIPGWVNVSPEWLTKNIGEIRTLFGYGLANPSYVTNGRPDSAAQLFIVSEVSHAAYLKVDYAFNLASFPVDGNFGARFVDTTLTEQANNSSVSGTGANAVLTFTPTRASHETSVFLPSWNARVTLADGLFARFAASLTDTRPTFAQLNPATSYSAANTTLQGSANSGNPNLSAEKSTNLDVDLEYYWGKANHVSVAAFDRYIEGYIQTANLGQETINGSVYNVTKPVNYQNAHIDGVEAAYSQFLDFLPGFWSGFGWDVNATYISGPFNDISKWAFNSAGIYERGPLSVRVSYTWAGSYLINPALSGGVAVPAKEYAMPRGNLSASINYRWNDHFTLTLDATNLNDGLNRAYDGAQPDGPKYYNITYQRFDATYSIGLRYRM